MQPVFSPPSPSEGKQPGSSAKGPAFRNLATRRLRSDVARIRIGQPSAVDAGVNAVRDHLGKIRLHKGIGIADVVKQAVRALVF
jgi:hypothetical protein